MPTCSWGATTPASITVSTAVNGNRWLRVLQPDPRLLAENARDDAAGALRGYDRSPEAVPSMHLWRGALPTGLQSGEHAIEVRAFDPWHGEQRARTRYQLQTYQAKSSP